MRRNIIFLFLIIFLLTPFIAFSTIHGPNECCLLTHDLNDVDGACDDTDIVGPMSGAEWCDTDDDGNPNALTANTINWGTCCFLDTVYSISDWLFNTFLIIAIAVFVISAYFILFSGGSPSNLETGKSLLLWGAVAIVLLALSKAIPAIVKSVVI